jgi:hypothetical protein
MRFAALLFALTALAQGVQDLPQIRGTVTEYASPTAISGARVTLYEFVAPEGLVIRKQVATAFTNFQGAFSIKPPHAGQYFLETSKPMYLTGEDLEGLGWGSGRSMMEIPLIIPGDDPDNLHFTLIRPGGLTGRVIDENDKPVPDFTVIALSRTTPNRTDRAVTDKDGVFTFPAIIPSARVIRVGPRNDTVTPARSAPTKDDLALIEQDVETAYWPGGVSDPALALPVKMIPGAVATVGTIRLRKVFYYRARLSYSHECGAKEAWLFTLDNTSRMGLAQCGKENLIDKLRPGTHSLAIWTGGAQLTPAATNWALVPFSIGSENVEIPISFMPVVEVPGRIVSANASKLPDLSKARIALRSTTEVAPLGPGFVTASIGQQGDFVFPKVAWPQHRISFPTLDPSIAIKEIRYAGQRIPDGMITLVPGAAFEIQLDDQPSSVSGNAPPQATVYVTKWPFASTLDRPYTYTAQADASGKFQIPALTPGDYRAIAVRSTLNVATLNALLSTATRITLEKGALKTVELK